MPLVGLDWAGYGRALSESVDAIEGSGTAQLLILALVAALIAFIAEE